MSAASNFITGFYRVAIILYSGTSLRSMSLHMSNRQLTRLCIHKLDIFLVNQVGSISVSVDFKSILWRKLVAYNPV